MVIVETVQEYVPTRREYQDKVLSTGENVTVCDVKFHNILMGGDQLTAARGRGAQANGG